MRAYLRNRLPKIIEADIAAPISGRQISLADAIAAPVGSNF
jgi:hypothetical protein